MFYQNILLVDDDADDREIFETALRRISTEVGFTAVASAIEALARLRAGHTADIIFLDLNMPIMNGMEFLAEIKKDKRLSDIPVIVFSTSGSSRSVDQAKELGAHDYITKPYEIRQLVDILQNIL
ncbi:MAG TPA: response regulator [Flavobacterium sp.]|jgi:CheY-like chemotaxis protein